MNKKKYFIVFYLFLFCTKVYSQNIAVLKYDGGGDWYSNPTSLKNLIRFSNDELNTKIDIEPMLVSAEDPKIFEYPILHMTGHGNVYFSKKAVQNLRTYLFGGGFLHIDDNYGMKPYILPQIEKLFPNKKLREVPLDHPIYNNRFKFPNGLPKIHEHDGLPPKALGIFHESNMIILYTYESDLGDGWEDSEVHNDPQSVREKALQMGANIIKYAFEKSN